MNDKLLQEIKAYLDITWEDEGTNEKLAGIMERGKARLEEIAGISLDFEDNKSPKALLFDYCRYARGNALEAFEKNFQGALLGLRIGGMTADAKKDRTADGDV